MQPSSGASAGGPKGSSAMKRYGPIIGIVVAIAIVVGIVLIVGRGDNKKTVEPATTPATVAPASTTTIAATTTTGGSTSTSTAGGIGTTTADTTAPTTPSSGSTGGGPATYPLSFSDAKTKGITVDWGSRCDTKTGHVAVPDFFAPECYAPFTGDNGGPTADGVTGDTITIAVYQGIANDPIIGYITDAIKVQDTNAQQAETMTNMVNYFESYYETYGRKVKLQFVEGTGIANDETAARADAVHIAEDIKPFMVWGGPALTSAFADELAARGVSCLACTPGQPPDWYVQRDPFVWGIATGTEQAQVHVLEMIKKQLIGKNAVHAGDAFTSTPRKFGLLYIESSATSKELADKFAASMSANGAPLAETVAYQLDPATIQQSASQAIAKFKAAGVTSVIFNGDPVGPRDFTREATAQGYFPEWIIGVSALVDLNAFARTYDQEQWKHAFGYTSLAGRVTPEISGYYALYTWFTGKEPPAKDTIGIFAPPRGVLRRPARRRPEAHSRHVEAGVVQRRPNALGDQSTLAELGRTRDLAGPGLRGHRRRHRGVVEPLRERAGRDPQGRPGDVRVHRRRQALHAGCMAVRGQGLRSERRCGPVRRAAGGRGAAVLPEARGLNRSVGEPPVHGLAAPRDQRVVGPAEWSAAEEAVVCRERRGVR